ncbi:MAG: hypothetical protein ACOYYS_11290, partial [Chloroflexota bacterium]
HQKRAPFRLANAPLFNYQVFCQFTKSRPFSTNNRAPFHLTKTTTEQHRPDFHWFGNVLFNSRA